MTHGSKRTLRSTCVIAFTLLCLWALTTPVQAQSDAAHADSVRSDSAHADTTRLPAPAELTSADRWKHYKNEVLGWRFVVGGIADGTISHLSDDPEAWRNDALGYGARVASGTGAAVISVSTEYGLSALIDADIRRYRPLRQGSFFERLGYASRAAVTVRTAHGRRLPDVPLAGGVIVSTLAKNQWEYGNLRPGEVALTLASVFAFETLRHLYIEFIDPYIDFIP